MNKDARMKQQAALAKKERLEAATKQIQDSGLNFVDHELPPDEVDKKTTNKSILSSIRTFIPYTDEWWEAKAAEDEMDDLKKIRIEKIKASDLLTKTKSGKAEEALQQMMSETNNDFFFFNKMKYKMENEGTYKYEDPNKKANDPFAEMNRSNKKNRLRKAINATVASSMDEDMTGLLASLTSDHSEKKKQLDQNAPCSWRGKDKNKVNLRCENVRFVKPMPSTQINNKKNNKPEVLSFCNYHTPFCVSDTHNTNEVVKIATPNELALCNECYMIKKGKRCPAFNVNIVPGVIPASIIVKQAIANLKDSSNNNNIENNNSPSKPNLEKSRKKKDECMWIPNGDNIKARGYECINKKLIDPITKQECNTCPWHVTKCIRDHPPNTNPTITIPNQYGLCAMHYLSEHGKPPNNIQMPYPGMVLKKSKDFWLKGRHFASPKIPPPIEIYPAIYTKPYLRSDIYGKVLEEIRKYKYRRKFKKMGHISAIKIQALFRGNKIRNIHDNLKYEKKKYYRLISAVKIQSLMRRFLYNRKAKNIRVLYNQNTLIIQRVYRGWLDRKRLKIKFAAKKIQRLFKLINFFKFKDSVILIMQLRRLFKKKTTAVIELQRVCRGYLSRIFVYNKRLWILTMKVNKRKIITWYRIQIKKRNYCPWIPPPESWMLQKICRKLAYMIYELYIDRERRKELFKLIQYSVPPIQKLLRGFLGRSGHKKLKYLRNAMKNWLNPRLASEFMENYLNSKIFYLNIKQNNEQIISITRDNQKNTYYIRNFLPENEKTRFEVLLRIFEPALEKWYESVNVPLSLSEKKSIVRKFKNPINGKIQIKSLDEFINFHKLPCDKHGRFICGDCVFRKNCQIGSCKCTLFKSSTEDGHGICITCDHPGSLHSLCPSQVRILMSNKVNKVPSLLKVLNTIREPDMSLPTGLEGVLVEDMIISEPTADDLRELRTIKIAEDKKQADKLDRNSKRSLSKSLALCEIDGDTIHDNKQYWKQYGISMVKPIENVEDKRDIAVFDPIQYDNRSPDYNISQTKFWTLTGKNPNKNTRDYNEKFDHNMPVPIVHNDEVVYSFQGPELYFNIINQIIRMEKNVDYDNPDFLKLVVDHIQIFERHWRKMVADIRIGKLDRKLIISEESRLIFESANIPKPLLALKLDRTFRNLGFHKKVLGKDIKIQPYAQLKNLKLIQKNNQSQSRKHSLPLSAIHTTSSNLLQPIIQNNNLLSLDNHKELNSPNYTSIKSKPSLTSNDSKAPLLLLDKNSSSSSKNNTNPLKKTSSKRELLLTLGNVFKTTSDSRASTAESSSYTDKMMNTSRLDSANSTNRPGSNQSMRSTMNTATSSKRRGSHSDSQRPATAYEIDAIHYNVSTEARDNYHHTIKMDGDRFVCPFPACGKSFHSLDAAFYHLPIHEQRTRLYAPTPLPDSHLNFYWPMDVPWIKESKYIDRTIPPGSYPCTMPGCLVVCSTKNILENHLKLVHNKG